MSVKNTAAFTQDPFLFSAQLATANGGSETSPTNTALLAVAGPDGSDLWGFAALANATGASANRVDLFASPDGGTTFNLLPFTVLLSAFTLSATAALAPQNLGAPNGVPLAPSNPFPLTGAAPGPFTHVMSKSLLTENALYFKGQYASSGAANAQVVANALNDANAVLPAAPTLGTTIDFTAGFTNTGAATLQAGNQAAGVSITRPNGNSLSAGDLTAGFRYRAVWSGTAWVLLLTARIYAAVSESQGVTVHCWGAHR